VNLRGDQRESEVDSLRTLLNQAIRMGERLLTSAQAAVGAYHEYATLTEADPKAAGPAARRLGAAMNDLARLVGDAKVRSGRAPRRKGRQSHDGS